MGHENTSICSSVLYITIRMWRVTSNLLLAFFDRHLLRDPAPLLDGPSSDYPEVQVVDGDQ